MTRLISCISAKGGVGKTTLVSNLAAALSDLGENTIAMDANLTTPNLGLHVGMHLAPKTIHHVLKGKANLRDAIYPHSYGFKIIPASLNLNDLKDVDPSRLPEISFSLLGRADYILLDCAAGIGKEALSGLAASDEVLVVTNPTTPAVTDALKVVRIAQNSNMNIIGTVVNRVTNSPHELKQRQISDVLGIPNVAVIPEDHNIPVSVHQKKLIFESAPTSPAAVEIKRLAAWMTGREFLTPIDLKQNDNLLQRFVNWLTT